MVKSAPGTITERFGMSNNGIYELTGHIGFHMTDKQGAKTFKSANDFAISANDFVISAISHIYTYIYILPKILNYQSIGLQNV